MAHQCVHCGRLIASATKELFEGCKECSGKFFFYVRDEDIDKVKDRQLEKLTKVEKQQVEKDVRQILDLSEEAPVILDIESIRVLEPGKFEIDLVSLMTRRPIVFKLEEGKYIIDLESGLPMGKENKNKR